MTAYSLYWTTPFNQNAIIRTRRQPITKVNKSANMISQSKLLQNEQSSFTSSAFSNSSISIRVSTTLSSVRICSIQNIQFCQRYSGTSTGINSAKKKNLSSKTNYHLPSSYIWEVRLYWIPLVDGVKIWQYNSVL